MIIDLSSDCTQKYFFLANKDKSWIAKNPVANP